MHRRLLPCVAARGPRIPFALLTSGAALLLTAGADAQLTTRQYSTRHKKNLGTYHVATNSWSRPGQGAANIVAGASLYDNTCLPMSGLVPSVNQLDATEINGDTGQIPSTSNNFLAFTPGTLADRYTVNGWRWGICPGEPAAPGLTITATMFHFESLDSCAFGPSLAAGVPISAVAVTGLPPGPLGTTCYLFNVDLENTTLEFDINGDANQVHSTPGTDGQPNDTFGLAVFLQRSDGMPFQTTTGNGVALGGNKFGPALPDCNGGQGFVGESTSFFMSSTAIDTATGLGQLDALEAIGGPTPGCYNLGHLTGVPGAPWAGIYHELYGLPATMPPVTFSEFCFGDGGVSPGCTPCPCGNDSLTGTTAGCLNHDLRSADLAPQGVPSVMNDTLGFTMSGGTSTSFGNLVSGSVALPNNMTNPCFGLNSGVTSVLLDGLRCAGGVVVRHGSRSMDANGVIGNGVANPGLNGWGGPFPAPANGLIAQGANVNPAAFAAGSTRFFQVFYRTNATMGCLTGQNTSQTIQVDILP